MFVTMRNIARPASTFALSATSFVFSLLATLFVISVLAACAGRSVSSAPVGGPWKKTNRTTMRAFSSQDELKNYFLQLAEERKRQGARANANNSAPPAPAPTGVAQSATTKAGEGYAAKDEAESVTNTQHAGVDEGGIVKLHGDHLVVLRRGRLFTG